MSTSSDRQQHEHLAVTPFLLFLLSLSCITSANAIMSYLHLLTPKVLLVLTPSDGDTGNLRGFSSMCILLGSWHWHILVFFHDVDSPTVQYFVA